MDFSSLVFSFAFVSSPHLQLHQTECAVECWIVQHSCSAFFPLLLAPCVGLDLRVTEAVLPLPSFRLLLSFFLCTVVLLANMQVGDR